MEWLYRFWKANRVAVLMVAGLFVSLPPAANAVDTSDFSTEAGFRWENNLSLSPASGDKVSDLTTHVNVAGNFGLKNTETDQFILGINAHYDHLSNTGDLSNYGAQLALIYQHNFGANFNAPWLSAGVDGQVIRYKDSDVRDGYIMNTTVTIGRQLNPKVELSGGYRYFLRRSNMNNRTQMEINWQSDEVFDLNRNNIFAHIRYATSETTTIYADINYFDGDVAASGRTFSNGGDFPRAIDTAFGDDYRVWKIDATGYDLMLGVTSKFTNQLSLDTFVAYLSADGESNNDYDNTIIQAFLTYQF